MAVKSSSTSLRRYNNTASPPNPAALTLMAWVRKETSGVDIDTFYLGTDTTEFDGSYIWLSSISSALYLEINGDIYTSAGGHIFSGEWFHVALTIDGNAFKVYLSSEEDPFWDAELVIDETHVHGISSLALLSLWFNGRNHLANPKVYEAVLTPAEIRLERDAYALSRTADIWGAFTFEDVDNLADSSGQGQAMSLVGGTLANVADGPAVLDAPPPPVAPDPPTNLAAAASGFEEVTLTWDDNSDDEVSFEIQRCAGAACSGFALLTTVAPGVTTYVDPASQGTPGGLQADQTYRYRVRARGADVHSDWSNEVEVTTTANRSVRFPGDPGTYYHVTEDGSRAFVNTPFGFGGLVAWIKIDASGYATIATSLENFRRCFIESVVPSDDQEWDYDSIAQTYTWFGIINGRLVFEARDGRIAARGVTGGTVQYSTAFARDAAVAAFRATHLALPHSDGVTVPIPTFETSSFGITNYFATFPQGTDAPHGDLSQSIVVAGPALTPGQWYRVGYRWESLPAGELPPSGYTSSTVQLYVDCAVVSTGAWDVAVMGGRGFNEATSQTQHGRYVDAFIGGDPNDVHRAGRTVTAFELYDLKFWTGPTPDAAVVADECSCVGVQPPLWWKLRGSTDLDDDGSGTGPITQILYPPLVVGTVESGPTPPNNPCNILTPPDELPPDEDEDGPSTPTAPSVVGATRTRHILRIRQAPYLSEENRRIVYHKLQLDLQAGIGLTSGQGSDPVVYLSWSDDQGRTWSDPYPESAGVLGAYTTRVIWRRLGQARSRIFRVLMSDPCDWTLIDSFLDLTPGSGR